jgi:MFS family permease
MPTMNHTRDRLIIFACAGLRAIAISFSSVILTLYLSSLGFSSSKIALLIALGLAGCAGGTFLAMRFADRFGRKRMLIILGLLMAAGGFLLSIGELPTAIAIAIFVGMVNGMGRDRGMGLTIEQAILPAITAPQDRTKTFAWYNVTVDVGNAVGALLAFLPAYLRKHFIVDAVGSYQIVWIGYGIVCMIGVVLAFCLSSDVELKDPAPQQQLSEASKKFVYKFAGISALDSLGGGFLTTALITYWFFKRFGVDESFLGPLIFWARLSNSLSHLGAAWLAKRIGLVNTMVFTHLPSSLLLMTVPFMPNLWVAVVLFILRELLVEMDVPTRQSYIMAIVKNNERTAAAGITNLTRSVAWAVAPVLAAPVMGIVSFSAPLVIGPALKVFYDISLFRAFRHVKPPEEK